MDTITTVKNRLGATVHRQQAEYAGDTDRPLGGYAAAMGAFGGLVAGTAALARLTGRQPPERISPWDTALIAVATYKLSRLVAKDSVTSPLRAPFTRYEGVSGPSELAEEVRGSGPRKAVGELITCPFCLATWAATALTLGHMFFPRATRLATTALTAQAGADFLQFAYAAAEQAADSE